MIHRAIECDCASNRRESEESRATVKVRIPIHAHVAADDGDLDTFRLAVCAAADWVRCRDGPTGDRLVVTLAGFWASWARRDITAAKVEAIAKSLRPGGRSARPLRDYLAGADLTRIIHE